MRLKLEIRYLLEILYKEMELRHFKYNRIILL